MLTLDGECQEGHENAWVRDLWAAVLSTALQLAKGEAAVFNKDRKLFKVQSRRWIVGRKGNFDFASKCIGMDPAEMQRLMLAQIKEADPSFDPGPERLLRVKKMIPLPQILAKRARAA